MCQAFWWSTLHHDGNEACEFVHGKGRQQYHSVLHILASNYVKAVDRYAKKNPDLRKEVDQPNTHRLLELTAHTIPQYGHIFFVCELVFEAAHQPLKFFLSRNTTSNSHLFAVHVVLAKDRIIRLWSLWSIYSSESERAHAKDASNALP